ncbi:hypothetical protein H5P30_07640 [Puniceicoccus vermicola]|uniref:Uncharacterized protein n=1 Tax=Puniceicoccus vermicola TaxID=388746 RepID=A0A7X1AZ67_9BACT|nr:hypothetical protein [Puniceicoccus vermicola]
MQQNNLFLPGFHHAFGRSPKSGLKKLEAARDSIMESLPGQLPRIFGEVLPVESIPKRPPDRSGIRPRFRPPITRRWPALSPK